MATAATVSYLEKVPQKPSGPVSPGTVNIALEPSHQPNVEFGSTTFVKTGTEWEPHGRHLTIQSAGICSAKIQTYAASVSSVPVTSPDYAVTLDRIGDLRREELEEDRPTEYAYQGVLNILVGAARELGLDFPRASASVGPNGSLRITWSHGSCEVRLVYGGAAGNGTYIYSELGREHAVDYVVDGDHLAKHLRWALQQV